MIGCRMKELYLAQGYYYYESSEKNWDKAIEAFNKLVELYPDLMIGHRSLGFIYIDIEEWDKALEYFEVNKRNKVEYSGVYCDMAIAYRAKGLYQEAEDILEYYLDNFQDRAAIHRQMALTYACQGKYELALAEVDKAFILAPDQRGNLIWKGHIYRLKDDFLKAEKEYEKLLDAEEQIAHLAGHGNLGLLYLSMGRYEESIGHFGQGIEQAQKLDDYWRKSRFHLRLAYVYLISKQPEESIRELDEAWQSAEQAESIIAQIRVLYMKGLAQLEMKLFEEAQRTADELMKYVETWINGRLVRYYWHLLGMIEYKRGNLSRAIEYCEKAISFLNYQGGTRGLTYRWKMHALFDDSLAMALYKMGNLDKAQEQYELITQLTTGKLNFSDRYAKSFYILGKICEEQDDTAKAIEHYEKFLSLWKDADPEIAEVEDAKKRLAGLK